MFHGTVQKIKIAFDSIAESEKPAPICSDRKKPRKVKKNLHEE